MLEFYFIHKTDLFGCFIWRPIPICNWRPYEFLRTHYMYKNAWNNAQGLSLAQFRRLREKLLNTKGDISAHWGHGYGWGSLSLTLPTSSCFQRNERKLNTHWSPSWPQTCQASSGRRLSGQACWSYLQRRRKQQWDNDWEAREGRSVWRMLTAWHSSRKKKQNLYGGLMHTLHILHVFHLIMFVSFHI